MKCQTTRYRKPYKEWYWRHNKNTFKSKAQMASKHKAGSTATDIYSVTQMKHANVLTKNSHTEQQWKNP